MEELSKIIGNATRSIKPGYFRLAIAGGDPIYRERVYCYELYHQMRRRWSKQTPYYLNGEVDKAAHPILMGLGIGLSKPDFLVHQPGYMSGNHAVIEVKHSDSSTVGLRKDLKTLSLFVNRVGYQRAILLIYGDNASDAVVDSINRLARRVQDLAPIELWVHQAAGRAAKHITTLTPTTNVPEHTSSIGPSE
jgi:hypothetical protein